MRLLAGTWFAGEVIQDHESAKFDYIEDESTGEVTSFENAHYAHRAEGALGVGVLLKRNEPATHPSDPLPGIREIFYSVTEIRPELGAYDLPGDWDDEVTAQLTLTTHLGHQLMLECVMAKGYGIAEWKVATLEDEVNGFFSFLEDSPTYWPDPLSIDDGLDDGPIRLSFRYQETVLESDWNGLLSALVKAESSQGDVHGAQIYPNFDSAIFDMEIRGGAPAIVNVEEEIARRLEQLDKTDSVKADGLRLVFNVLSNAPEKLDANKALSILEINPFSIRATKWSVARARFLAKLLSETGDVLSDAFKELSHTQPIRPRRGDAKSQSAIEFSDELNELLSELTDGRYEVHKDSSSNRVRREKRPMVHDTLTGAQIPFEHVGTGISQVLPILNEMAMVQLRFDAADDYNENRRAAPVHLIEQPELHLHPKLQSRLTELIIRWAKNHNIQVVLETHSESILLRAQKLVRNGTINRDDLAICYVDSKSFDDVAIFQKAKGSNVISNINIAGNGDILDPFPNSFVDMRIADWL